MKIGLVVTPLLHAALDEVHAGVDEPAHLDGAAEGDLAVALTEVQVAAGQRGAGDVDGVVHARAAGEVLDVVVSAVLAGRHGASALLGHRLRLGTGERAGQRAA
jgi:hypothetical protein